MALFYLRALGTATKGEQSVEDLNAVVLFLDKAGREGSAELHGARWVGGSRRFIAQRADGSFDEWERCSARLAVTPMLAPLPQVTIPDTPCRVMLDPNPPVVLHACIRAASETLTHIWRKLLRTPATPGQGHSIMLGPMTTC